MRYANVLAWASGQLWALHPAHLTVLRDVLAFRSAGGRFGPEELAARLEPGEVIEGVPQAEQVVVDADGQRIDLAALDGGAPNTGGGTLVVPIRGMILQRSDSMQALSGGATSTDELIKVLTAAREADQVRQVLLDVDSPGGTTFGVMEAAAAIRELRQEKRVVAQVNSFAASAAYWLASQANEVVVTPSGAAGSIGVFTVHQDESQRLEQEGVKVTLIRDPKFKAEREPFHPLSEEALEHLQAQVRSVRATFEREVAKGRGVTVRKVQADFGQGRTFLAAEALEAGLVDRVASMQQTLDRMVGGNRRSRGRTRALAGSLLGADSPTLQLDPEALAAAAQELLDAGDDPVLTVALPRDQVEAAASWATGANGPEEPLVDRPPEDPEPPDPEPDPDTWVVRYTTPDGQEHEDHLASEGVVALFGEEATAVLQDVPTGVYTREELTAALAAAAGRRAAEGQVVSHRRLAELKLRRLAGRKTAATA